MGMNVWFWVDERGLFDI